MSLLVLDQESKVMAIQLYIEFDCLVFYKPISFNTILQNYYLIIARQNTPTTKTS